MSLEDRVHECGRCGRLVELTDTGWIHIVTHSFQDEPCVRAVPEYLYDKYQENWREAVVAEINKEFDDAFEINLPHVDRRLLEGRWNPVDQPYPVTSVPYAKVTVTIEALDGSRVETIEIHKAKGVSFETKPILEQQDTKFSMVTYDTQRLKAQLNLEAIFDEGENRILVHRVTTQGKEIKDER